MRSLFADGKVTLMMGAIQPLLLPAATELAAVLQFPRIHLQAAHYQPVSAAEQKFEHASRWLRIRCVSLLHLRHRLLAPAGELHVG